MSTIIVCTDFSKTSRNALAYTCNFIKDKAVGQEVELLLLHIFTIPANYSGEGLSIITINDEWNDAEIQMQEELDWVKENYPGIRIKERIKKGFLLDSLLDQIKEVQPALIVIGASGNFGDMWSWDKDILDLLRDATVPVLTVPPQVSFRTMHNIGYACNLQNVTPATPFETIKNLVHLSNATLHVLTVNTPQLKKIGCEQKETLVHERLKEVAPQYHVVEETHVVETIGHFVQQQRIDLLLVTPKRHGVWEALFRKSYTKELMRLNSIPIMALHGK